MKKVLLFLLLLVSVQTFAQIRRTAVFDFTNPTALNPSITPEPENAQNVMVTDKVFKNLGVNISFNAIGQYPIGARIQTSVLNGNTSYFLSLASISDMTFGVANGATLNEIRFSEETIFGGLYLKDGEAGTMNPYETYKKWEAGNSTSVSSVTFRNTDKDSHFLKIYVTYTEPSDVLAPISTSIQQGSIVESFSNISLLFSDNMTLYSSNGITLSDGTKTWNLSASVSGSNVTLNAPNEIDQDGTYTINIPARCFKNAAGYENKALSYTFTVNTPKNTFIYSSVTPAEGNVDLLPSEITLTYPTYIKVNTTKLALCDESGEAIAPITVTKKVGDSKSAVLSFAETVPEGISDKGKYTITVPENTIQNGMGEIYNPAFTLTYTIGGTTPGPTPDPDPIPEDTETMKLAKKLVNTTGVGYPTASSETRSNLKALVDAESTPSDEDLQTAIDAFYKDANVELPTVGKWYYVYNVDSKGAKRYLSCKNGTLSITTQMNEATAFEANEGNAFKNIDGKYLHTSGLSDNTIKLTLAKFNIASVEAKSTFGLLSIYGFCKKNVLNKELNAYALVDCENNQLVTDESITDLQFEIDNHLSSAFSFAETSKPDDEIKTEETAFAITPSVVEKNGNLTLTFPDVETVTVADGIDAYIANASGARIESISVIPSTTQSNQFTISIAGFDNGNYQVVFPEGSFLYQKNGKTVQTQLIQKEFTIGKSGSSDDGKFNETYNQFIVKPSVNSDYIKDSDLNNFTIRIINGDYSGLVADPSKTVRVAKYSNNYTMATGHFEACPEDEAPGYTVIKLLLDNPIIEGSFAPSTYSVVVEAGTFGDANFGKYLADKTSVSAQSCLVNSRRNFDYIVNNDKATGIDEVTTDSDKPSIIYDLMGRRVQNMSRPGIYIVNGKKVVKK